MIAMTYISIRTPERDLIASIVLIKPSLLIISRHILRILQPDTKQKVLISCQQLVNVH